MNLASSLPQFISSFFSYYKSSVFLISSSVKLDFITSHALITMSAVNLCLLPKRGSIKEGHFILIRENLIISAVLIICIFYPECTVTYFPLKLS